MDRKEMDAAIDSRRDALGSEDKRYDVETALAAASNVPREPTAKMIEVGRAYFADTYGDIFTSAEHWRRMYDAARTRGELEAAPTSAEVEAMAKQWECVRGTSDYWLTGQQMITLLRSLSRQVAAKDAEIARLIELKDLASEWRDAAVSRAMRAEAALVEKDADIARLKISFQVIIDEYHKQLASSERAEQESDALRADNAALVERCNNLSDDAETECREAHAAADALRAEVAGLRELVDAARNFRDVKGRHHTEIATRRLISIIDTLDAALDGKA